MRRGGPPAHPASSEQIRELRDRGLTWPEIADQVDMTVSGAWSRYRRARPPKPPHLGRWQQVLADALDQNLAIGVRAAVADHLGRAPTRAELTAARRAAHGLVAVGRARVLHVPGADADANAPCRCPRRTPPAPTPPRSTYPTRSRICRRARPRRLAIMRASGSEARRDIGPFNLREYLLLVVHLAASVCVHGGFVVRGYKQRVDILIRDCQAKVVADEG
jgi:hypothetical protein